MKVEFVEDCEIEVIKNFNEALDEVESSSELFRIGEQTEFEIIDHPQKFDGEKLVDDPDYVNVQFSDGSMAYCLCRQWFKEV